MESEAKKQPEKEVVKKAVEPKVPQYAKIVLDKGSQIRCQSGSAVLTQDTIVFIGIDQLIAKSGAKKAKCENRCGACPKEEVEEAEPPKTARQEEEDDVSGAPQDEV